MPVDPERVKQIFLDAIDKPEAHRAAYLAEACSGDSELYRRVDSLLKAYVASGGWLGATNESPIENTGAYIPNDDASFTVDPGSLAIGTLIAGKYRLIEVIGEGGMGSVYMAQQTEPVKRQVAVKLIKAGMDSRHVLRASRPSARHWP